MKREKSHKLQGRLDGKSRIYHFGQMAADVRLV
jgi:hypothetical protein